VSKYAPQEDEMSLKKMGEAVRSTREMRKLSIRELARRADTNPNTILNLEKTGEVTVKTLLKVAKALKAKASDFLYVGER
jgi:transcriptional regulator with XRE-family HTH domain